jgi:hypothetical protein
MKKATRSRHVYRAVLIPLILWHNRQTITHLVLRPKLRNRHGDFEAQIMKPELSDLRPKLGNLTTMVLRPNQETCTPHLPVHGADRTQRHPTSRSSGHRVPDLCLTILDPLHQVSYSCLDPCHCPSCRSCHLHTMRQANTFLHTRYIVVEPQKCPRFEFNPWMSMTHHIQT